MKLFEKLNYSIKDFDPERLKGQRHTFYGNPPRPTISYYLIKDMEYFRGLCPHPICKIKPDTLFFAEITGEGLLKPHRDHNVSCCVNLYFEPNGSTTFFHQEKENIDAFVYPGKTTANIYDLHQVDTVGQFIAEKNDCYLLNVSEIHSVLSPNPGARRMITWQWRNASFDEVLENIIQ
jgi:hypothetical protein